MERRGSPRAGVALAIALTLATPVGAVAQLPAPRVTVEIRQVAGSNVYLDLGTDDGVAAGDTLEVRRGDEGTVIGRLTVVAATAVRSVLTFVGQPFPLVTGETVELELARAPPRSRDPAPPAPAPAASRTVASAPHQRPHGRVSLEVAVNRSTTSMGLVDPQDVSRTFATPAVRMDATVPYFVGGFTLRTRARVSHRYSPDMDFADPTSAQVYDLSLEREFTRVPLRLTLGRFYSPVESFSGFWDGVSMRFGGRGFGVGFLAGLEPEAWSQEPSLDLPKATVFVDYGTGGGGWEWSGDVSTHVVAPRTEGLDSHVFLGVGQRVRMGALRLNADVQLDRDPGGGSVRLSEGVANATLALAPTFSLRVGGSRRERYSVYSVGDPFGPRRDRVGAGLSLRMGSAFLSADQAWNRYAGGIDRVSWSGSFSLSRLPGLPGVGWTTSGSYWTGGGDNALSAGSAVNFRLASARLRVGYRLHRSVILGRERILHAPDFSMDVPVPGDLALAVRTRGQWGDQLTAQYLSVGLTRVF